MEAEDPRVTQAVIQEVLDAFNELELVDDIDHSRPLFHQIRELRLRLKQCRCDAA